MTQPKRPPSAKRPPSLRGGIDLGGTKIEAIVVDGRHQVMGSSRRPTPTSGTPADVAREMAAAMMEAASAAGTEASRLSGVGVGSPGSVDTARAVASPSA